MTELRTPSHEPSSTDHDGWDYTARAVENGLDQEVARGGRFYITRETGVLNGVYTGKYGGEAITVDYDRDPAKYDKHVQAVLEKCLTADGRIDKSLILGTVFEYVKEVMPYSADGVKKLNETLGIQDYRKVSLDAYVQEGVGVCRHQALLAATMLEIMKSKDVVSGEAHMNRSKGRNERTGEPTGHAWVRYTNGRGDVIIMDPAQNFLGTLEDAQKREGGWDYLHPEEKMLPESQEIKKELGESALVKARGAVVELDKDGMIIMPWRTHEDGAKNVTDTVNEDNGSANLPHEAVDRRQLELVRSATDRFAALVDKMSSGAYDKTLIAGNLVRQAEELHRALAGTKAELFTRTVLSEANLISDAAFVNRNNPRFFANTTRLKDAMDRLIENVN